MTEAEWLDCTAPHTMLYYLSEKGTDRKMCLFACACLRRVWCRLQEQSLERKAVEVAEWFADGLVDKREIQNIHGKLAEKCYGPEPSWGPFTGAACELTSRPRAEFGCRRASEVAGIVAWASGSFGGDPMLTAGEKPVFAGAEEDQTRILRDIFGNPFRPITFDPVWLTPTVVQLAQSIYDDRAFDRLPVLADALHDAGCDNDEILTHCRGPGPHVRGCWALDLMLGKQ